MGQLPPNTVITQMILCSVAKLTGRRFVPAAVSNRHVHLSEQDIETLFGKGHALTPIKPLSQPGQFAAAETVSLLGPKGTIEKIRVLGPARSKTQVEISVTDSFKLGIRPVVRMSGDLAGSPGGTLSTQHGSVELREGVVVSARHLHISPDQAQAMGLADGQEISLKSGGPRSVILEHVVVRSGQEHDLEVHLDMDEANAALIRNGDMLEIV